MRWIMQGQYLNLAELCSTQKLMWLKIWRPNLHDIIWIVCSNNKSVKTQIVRPTRRLGGRYFRVFVPQKTKNAQNLLKWQKNLSKTAPAKFLMSMYISSWRHTKYRKLKDWTSEDRSQSPNLITLQACLGLLVLV
jgi:hypothetical protein